MSTSIKLASRIVIVVAVAASLSLLFAVPTATHTPYLSALSDLAATPAYAAGCPDKACDRGISCVTGVGFKCIRFNGKGCTATAC